MRRSGYAQDALVEFALADKPGVRLVQYRDKRAHRRRFSSPLATLREAISGSRLPELILS